MIVLSLSLQHHLLHFEHCSQNISREMNCDSQVSCKDVSNLWPWPVSQSDIRDEDQDPITRQVLRGTKDVEFIPHPAWHLYLPQLYHVQEGSWQGVICIFLLEIWCPQLVQADPSRLYEKWEEGSWRQNKQDLCQSREVQEADKNCVWDHWSEKDCRAWNLQHCAERSCHDIRSQFSETHCIYKLRWYCLNCTVL